MKSTNSLDLDFLVIGGGPAGSTCAIQLARAGRRVAIVESSDFSGFRIGETLEPSLTPILRDLDLDIGGQEWAAPCSGISAAWGQPNVSHRGSMFNPYGNGWRVDRRRFDKALFECARNSGVATFLQSKVTAAERHREHWTYTLHGKNQAMTGQAQWIVAATGRGAHPPFVPKKSRIWVDALVGIALVRIGSGEDCASNSNRALVEATPHGWWYSACVPGRSQVAIFFTDADILPKSKVGRSAFLLAQLEHCAYTPSTCPFIATLVGKHRWTGFDARSSLLRVAQSDGWIAVGDALMALDPLSGRGVSEAIHSGMDTAAKLVGSCNPSHDHNRALIWAASIADRFGRYCQDRRRTYLNEMRWPTSTFWQRRHVS